MQERPPTGPEESLEARERAALDALRVTSEDLLAVATRLGDAIKNVDANDVHAVSAVQKLLDDQRDAHRREAAAFATWNALSRQLIERP